MELFVPGYSETTNEAPTNGRGYIKHVRASALVNSWSLAGNQLQGNGPQRVTLNNNRRHAPSTCLLTKVT